MNSIRPSFFRLALVASLFASLGGCANMLTPIGQNNYDCNRKENPNSPYCHSFRAVEQATSNDVPPSRFDEKMSIEDVDKLTGISPVKKPESPSATSIEVSNPNTQQPITSSAVSQASSSELPDGTPVRIGPVIQRVWIRSFKDKNDMLTSDQVVYKEVVPTHWAGQATNQDIQSISSSGLLGAYPHKPVAPSVQSITPTLIQPDKKDESTSFTQPGNSETSTADKNDSSMPN